MDWGWQQLHPVDSWRRFVVCHLLHSSHERPTPGRSKTSVTEVPAVTGDALFRRQFPWAPLAEAVRSFGLTGCAQAALQHTEADASCLFAWLPRSPPPSARVSCVRSASPCRFQKIKRAQQSPRQGFAVCVYICTPDGRSLPFPALYDGRALLRRNIDRQNKLGVCRSGASPSLRASTPELLRGRVSSRWCSRCWASIGAWPLPLQKPWYRSWPPLRTRAKDIVFCHVAIH